MLQAPGAGASFSVGASVGVVGGTATELAISYPYGKKFKLSELAWDFEGVGLAGVHGSVGVGRRFRISLGVWSALTAGDGTMVDRDWNYPDGVSVVLDPNDRNWSDESRHPDTTLDSGTIVALNLSVLALRAGPFALNGLAGYKHDAWRWSARGGTYVYSDDKSGSRDIVGEFAAGAPVITYEQQYSVPYVGLGASLVWPAFRVESHLLFSPLVSASDSDFHVLRGVLFEGDYSGGTYVGLGLSAAWVLGAHWSATFGVEYQSIPQITGDVRVSGEEGSGFFPGGGGLALSAASLTLGAGYRF